MSDNQNLPLISVVIPTLNEAAYISPTLASVQLASGVEVIVVDGGSTDRTRQLARAGGARVVLSAPGRAVQLNMGAVAAGGDILFFLHADTQAPPGYDLDIRRALAAPDIVAGAFSLNIDVNSVGCRMIAWLANWRSRRWQMPYGDQGIFIKAALFRATGGFPELPIMDDFEFIRRLRQRGRIVTLPVPVLTSGRRWQALGTWRTTLINQLMIVGYYLGVPPGCLARWYRA